MSSFTVDPDHLDELANHMAQFANQVGRLNLAAEDFAGWTGDPAVGELLRDLCQTMDHGVLDLKTTIEYTGYSLVTGADHYRRADRSAAQATGGHSWRPTRSPTSA